MTILLQLLAPTIAVSVFWCGFHHAWLAILAYHLQTILWFRKATWSFRLPADKRAVLIALPTIIAGPLIYLLLPYITKVDISVWLESYGLVGWKLVLMIPYFGIIHPFIEQMHWNELRKKTYLSHLFFAGYHILVLCSLLSVQWLLFCFVALITVSLIWTVMTRKFGSLFVPALSHIFADLGMMIAVYVMVG